MNKLLIVNKEKDYTSRDVVNVICNIFKTKKVGHFGTLDPMATGVLVIGIGAYTKLGNIIPIATKEYVAEVLVGTSTDTLDITGNVIIEKDVKVLDKELLIKTLNSFLGKSTQQIPLYSAKKINGKKLYEYARENIEIDLPSKEIEIFSIELLDILTKDNKLYFTFKTKVSIGTFIRSLINDISNKMNIPMTMSNLIRTKQGDFNILDSCSLADIKNNNYQDIDITKVLDCNIIDIPNNLNKLIKNGAIIDKLNNKDYTIYKENNKYYVLYGTYQKDNTKMKPLFFFKD